MRTTLTVDDKDLTKLNEFLVKLKTTGYALNKQTAFRVMVDDFCKKYENEPILIGRKSNTIV